MTILLKNNASSLLALPVLTGDLMITVTLADAVLFPQPAGASEYFLVTLEDRRVVPNLREIVKCTARSDNVLTVERAQEGTFATAFFTGAVVSHRLTAGTVLGLIAEEAAARAAADVIEAAARATGILVETNRATAAEAAEVAARALAVFNEQTARIAADAAESAARIAADAAEVIARNAAIAASLGGAASPAAVAAAVAVETARAQGVEAAIVGGLATEINDRTAADNALSTSISALSNNTAGLYMKHGNGQTGDGGSVFIAFDVPFGDNCHNVQATYTGPTGVWISVDGVGPTGFTAYSISPYFSPIQDGPVHFYWLAFGN
jgi:hypothetical protein